MKNRLRQALLDKKLTLGTWIQVGHPTVAEILAHAGFDWICVDLEHGVIGIETMADIFRALGGSDVTPVVRLPANDPIWIHRCLDAGAQGLIVPMVNRAEEAEAAVREAKYPPQGRRGYGFSRANTYGAEFETVIESANDEIAVIVQIEHEEAIENLDAILEVKGIDGTFIGPYDLSGSLGVPGELDHPDVVKAMERYREMCAKHCMAAGIHVVRPNGRAVKQALGTGYTLVALGVDTVFLSEGARSVLEATEREMP